MRRGELPVARLFILERETEKEPRGADEKGSDEKRIIGTESFAAFALRARSAGRMPEKPGQAALFPAFFAGAAKNPIFNRGFCGRAVTVRRPERAAQTLIIYESAAHPSFSWACGG